MQNHPKTQQRFDKHPGPGRPAQDQRHDKAHSQNGYKDHEVYARIFEGIEDPMLVVGLNLQVLYLNAAAVKFFRRPKQKMFGVSFNAFLDESGRKQFKAAVKQAVVQLKQSRLDLEINVAKHDHPHAEVGITPVVERRSVKALRISLRDVGHERQIEALMREAQKMEALQNFVSGTTAELKHPLLAILKRIEAINANYKGRNFEYVSYKEFAGIINFLQSMHKQVKYCYDTISKLTDLSKKRLKFESEECQPNAVIREILRLKDNYFNIVDVKVQLRLQEKLPSIALGEIELNQILSNIIDNSVQAMPAGGTITIVTTAQRDQDRVRINVIDEGVGISPEELPHIFEPFFTTKQRGMEKNAGLGLSIVYALVKAASGQIHVKSSLRKGTTVQLIFPTAKRSAQ